MRTGPVKMKKDDTLRINIRNKEVTVHYEIIKDCTTYIDYETGLPEVDPKDALKLVKAEGKVDEFAQELGLDTSVLVPKE